MSVTLNNTSITYPDGSSQSTTYNYNTDLGSLISVSAFRQNDTWYNPGARYVIVKVVGGGGGGCGYCESGGAGGYAEGVFNIAGVSTVAITVGGGGGGTGYYSGSGGGGTSSFGSYISGAGGYGANNNYTHSGGHGGYSSGGSVNLYGGAGTGHVNSAGSHSGGRGGYSYFGGGAAQARNHGNLGPSIVGKTYYGAPGAGAPGNITDGSGYANHGSNGEAGMVVVYAYK
jgi:hypothetical protein